MQAYLKKPRSLDLEEQKLPPPWPDSLEPEALEAKELGLSERGGGGGGGYLILGSFYSKDPTI